MTTGADEHTIGETLARMDEGWTDFLARVQALPGEQLGDRLGDGGWTRKQMLAHIGTWHELTVERLSGLVSTGEPPGLDENEDVINARAARAAEGRTSGEILQAMQDSYSRLRREVARLTDEQLADHDGFAASVIAGNSYGHYRDHLADVGGPPGVDPGAHRGTAA